MCGRVVCCERCLEQSRLRSANTRGSPVCPRACHDRAEATQRPGASAPAIRKSMWAQLRHLPIGPAPTQRTL